MVGTVRSALPPPIVARAAPIEITIDAIGVVAPIVAVALQPDGQLEIPDERDVGWYELGASPGEPGASVSAAHVNWHHVDGPFVDLRRLEPGSDVTLALGRRGADAESSVPAPAPPRHPNETTPFARRVGCGIQRRCG
jgi:Sortase domain